MNLHDFPDRDAWVAFLDRIGEDPCPHCGGGPDQAHCARCNRTGSVLRGDTDDFGLTVDPESSIYDAPGEREMARRVARMVEGRWKGREKSGLGTHNHAPYMRAVLPPEPRAGWNDRPETPAPPTFDDAYLDAMDFPPEPRPEE